MNDNKFKLTEKEINELCENLVSYIKAETRDYNKDCEKQGNANLFMWSNRIFTKAAYLLSNLCLKKEQDIENVKYTSLDWEGRRDEKILELLTSCFDSARPYYDYEKNVQNDTEDYIIENKKDLIEDAYKKRDTKIKSVKMGMIAKIEEWLEDASPLITGSADGSYWINTNLARFALLGNEDISFSALKEFYNDMPISKVELNNPDEIDCMVREYVISNTNVVQKALQEVKIGDDIDKFLEVKEKNKGEER